MIGLEGATCNTALIPEMEEIGANILLAEHIGRALVVGSEPADRLDVDVPGPLGKAGKPHVVDHTLTQRGHGRSPFGFKRQDLCPGTDQIPQHAVLNDYAFYGEAVQSNHRFLPARRRRLRRGAMRQSECALISCLPRRHRDIFGSSAPLFLVPRRNAVRRVKALGYNSFCALATAATRRPRVHIGAADRWRGSKEWQSSSRQVAVV